MIMKCDIIYIEGHAKSEKQANLSLETFLNRGYDAQLVPGVTPYTIDETEFSYPDLPNSRLSCFKEEDHNKYLFKKSCIFNHLRFWNRVIEDDEPRIFAEHDSICTHRWKTTWVFDDFCFLAYDHCWKEPSVLHQFNRLVNYMRAHERQVPSPYFEGVNKFKQDYPLKYHRETVYQNHIMTPGTVAYAMTPAGAKKLLAAVEKYGIEQSDLQINSHVLGMTHVYPSPVKFNTENLNTSHGW